MDISAMEKHTNTSGVKNTDLLFANLFYDGSEGLFLKQDRNMMFIYSTLGSKTKSEQGLIR